MNYLTADDKPISAYTEDLMHHSIFTFSVQQEDYFLNFFMNYERVSTEIYVFAIGKYTFHIPSGMFVYAGDAGGSIDWVLSDELVGRKSVDLFVMPPSFKAWQLETPSLTSTFTGEYYIPVTKDAIPIVSECGRKTILASARDLYHQWKTKEYDAAFVV